MEKMASSEGRTFGAPGASNPPPVTGANVPRRIVVPGKPPYVREIATGMVWPATDELLQRGDLVQGCYDVAGTVFTPPEGHEDAKLIPQIDLPVAQKPPAKPAPRRKVAEVVEEIQQ